LDACERLPYPKDRFEVVVVDDGSEPALPDFSAGNVRLIRQPAAGPAAARNRGILASAGRWIAFTDDDCRPRPDWLSQLERAFRDHPDALIGGLTHNTLLSNPYAEASQFLVSCLYSYFGKRPKQRFFTSNNMAASREKLLEIGGFDEFVSVTGR
jgi:glycosyltransferase involved in cell wall biosynthesis